MTNPTLYHDIAEHFRRLDGVSPLTLYEFTLPTKTNAGHPYNAEIADFLQTALNYANGYTDCGIVSGAWRNGTGPVYETNRLIRVACKPEIGDRLIQALPQFFPDQQAFLVSYIGVATIYDAKTLTA